MKLHMAAKKVKPMTSGLSGLRYTLATKAYDGGAPVDGGAGGGRIQSVETCCDDGKGDEPEGGGGRVEFIID